jgi:MFS family permease
VRAAVLRAWLGLQRWRPVLTLLSSVCTASLGAGGLQVIYWGPKVLAPCLISPAVAEGILTAAPLAGAVGAAWAASDDRLVGRRPLVVLAAALVVGGSLLLACLLVFFAQLPWHGPAYGLRWLLGVPGALGAAAAAAGWFTLVGALLPLLVCEATPTHARARALAALLAATVIYGPWTLVAFGAAKAGNAVGADSALGGALLLYGCSAGAMLLFLTTVLLTETSGKDPEQILLETVNRGGYVLFHATSLIRGPSLG